MEENTQVLTEEKYNERVKKYLDSKGIMYGFLAGKLNISNSHMTNILNGDRTLTDDIKAKIIQLYPDCC